MSQPETRVRPRGPSRHEAKLRRVAFDKLLADNGLEGASHADIARWLNVGEATVSRLLNQRQGMGGPFLAALAKKLPARVPLQRFMDVA